MKKIVLAASLVALIATSAVADNNTLSTDGMTASERFLLELNDSGKDFSKDEDSSQEVSCGASIGGQETEAVEEQECRG